MPTELDRTGQPPGDSVDHQAHWAGAVTDALGEEGRRQGVDPRAVASFLIAVGDGLLLQHLIDPEGAPSADEIATALGVALPIAFAGATEPK